MIAVVTNLAMVALIGSQFFPSLREKLGIAFVLTLLLAPFSIPLGNLYVRWLRSSRLHDKALPIKEAILLILKGGAAFFSSLFWIAAIDFKWPAWIVFSLGILTVTLSWSARKVLKFFRYF